MDLINYYFTFGAAHQHKSGKAMRDTWVRVQAPNYIEARKIFVREFAEKEMRGKMWAFQYGASNFEGKSEHLYPDGEFLFIPYEK